MSSNADRTRGQDHEGGHNGLPCTQVRGYVLLQKMIAVMAISITLFRDKDAVLRDRANKSFFAVLHSFRLSEWNRVSCISFDSWR